MKRGAGARTDSGEAWGLVSFVFGILSIIGALIIPIIGIVFAILGIIFWYVQRRRGSTRFSRAGFFLSLTGIILAIVLVAIIAVVAAKNPELIARLQNLQGAA